MHPNARDLVNIYKEERQRIKGRGGEASEQGMVEITRRNLARGNIITAAYLGIQRVNNEKGEAGV